MSAFWNTWHKEIIRGAVLFCTVLVIGLIVISFTRHVRQSVVTNLPMALRDLKSEFARDDGGSGPRTAGATWAYRSKLAPKQWVWIRNTRGSVTVEPGVGDSLQISAVKSYRSSDTASVKLVAVPYAGGVAVCALWSSDPGCGPGRPDFEMRGGPFGFPVALVWVRRPWSGTCTLPALGARSCSTRSAAISTR